MKRVLILSMFLLLFAFSAAFATQTRTLTMGDANMVIHDDNNIWLFPSTIYDYPEMAIGEFGEYYYYYYDKENGSYLFTDVGVHYKFGEKKPFVMGLYFTTKQPNPEFPYDLANFSYTPLDNHRIDLFYSRMLGDNKFGFHFEYLHGARTHDVDSLYTYNGLPDLTEEKTDAYSFDFGLTMKDGKLDLAAGLALLSWTNTGFNGHDRTEPDGNMMFHLRGRYFHEVDQKITLVPHGGFEYWKLAGKEYDDWQLAEDFGVVTDQDEYKGITFDAGLGLNYTPAAGIMAIGDFGIEFVNETDTYEDLVDDEWESREYKYTWLTLPYFKIGIDAVVFDWMDLRMGATSYWVNQKNEYDYPADYYTDGDPAFTNEYKYSDVENTVYIGAGFHWGNLFIDTHINPEMILNGFNFISGREETMNYQVSLKYNMF